MILAQIFTDADLVRISLPLTIGVIAAIVSFFTSILVAIISHFLARKGKIDEIRINKGYGLAEDIAKKIQKIEDGYIYFEAFYNKNYGHLNDFKKAIQNFNGKPSLFEKEYHYITEHTKDFVDLLTLLQGAWLYIPVAKVDLVQKYLKICNFSYLTDDSFIINNHHEKFFENLLDSENKKKRNKIYSSIVKSFSKMKI